MCQYPTIVYEERESRRAIKKESLPGIEGVIEGELPLYILPTEAFEPGFHELVMNYGNSQTPIETYGILLAGSRKRRTDGKVKWRSKRAGHGKRPCHGR